MSCKSADLQRISRLLEIRGHCLQPVFHRPALHRGSRKADLPLVEGGFDPPSLDLLLQDLLQAAERSAFSHQLASNSRAIQLFNADMLASRPRKVCTSSRAGLEPPGSRTSRR